MIINGLPSLDHTNGTVVHINAGTHLGFTFIEWQIQADTVTLNDPYNPVTSFIMPDNDLELFALFI